MEDNIDPPLGGPKRRGFKGKNPIHERPPVNQAPVSAIPPFDANSNLSNDWTLLRGVIGPMIDQSGETCATVVFCYLLQAHYNSSRAVASHHDLDIDDLARYIKKKTAKETISNMNIARDYIANTGILKRVDTGRTKARLRVQGLFEVKNVSRDEVFAMIEESPLGISLETTRTLQRLGKEKIYEVPLHRQPPKKGEKQEPDHMAMIVAKGVDTVTGLEFLVLQNSWGKDWGNQGYARIFLHPKGTFLIIRPVESKRKSK